MQPQWRQLDLTSPQLMPVHSWRAVGASIFMAAARVGCCPAQVATRRISVGCWRNTSHRSKPRLDTVEDEAANPVILPTLYNKRGRLIVPPPLRGSHEILVRQNVVADRDGLDRIQDDDDLDEICAPQQLLVPIPASNALDIDDRLPANRRYCRPWTAQFLATLARAHYARFHSPLQVNSAVRTVEFQQRLLRTNGNAAPAEGETASPHLTGQAIDIAKHGLSLTEIAWLRGYLLPLVQQGRIDVEEEFQQSCFHISVYKKYCLRRPSARSATSRHSATTALAAAHQLTNARSKVQLKTGLRDSSRCPARLPAAECCVERGHVAHRILACCGKGSATVQRLREAIEHSRIAVAVVERRRLDHLAGAAQHHIYRAIDRESVLGYEHAVASRDRDQCAVWRSCADCNVRQAHRRSSPSEAKRSPRPFLGCAFAASVLTLNTSSPST